TAPSAPGPTCARWCWRATPSCTWSEDGPVNPIDFSVTRRAFLARYAGGLGSLALAHLLAADGRAAPSADPLAPKAPHHTPRAKSVICLFQHGGPSQVDLFDPKPELTKRHGQSYPGSLEVHFHTQVGKL